MTTSEFVRKIKKHGCEFYKHDKKHDVYINPSNGKKTRIPRHAKKELGAGITSSMLEDLGLK
ncbi:MAG: type II toxin-antitoxin system HicA family toxin [Defluviitaleaceae bacterium]|nr:type II toxin-antitoxin system HicA family toxin [Defluviitaleaceae bacterium]